MSEWDKLKAGIPDIYAIIGRISLIDKLVIEGDKLQSENFELKCACVRHGQKVLSLERKLEEIKKVQQVQGVQENE